MKSNFLIIGGDKRQQYLKKALEEKSYDVFHLKYSADIWVLDEIERFSHIILPIPLSKDKEYIYSKDNLNLTVNELIKYIGPCHTVFGSGFDSKTADFFEDNHIEFFDFMKDKIFKRANALLTAQGTLKLMLDNTEDYIVSKKALIIGFGDVGQTLAEILRNNGLEVYITARNERKLNLAAMNGYKTVNFSSFGSCIYLFDYIFGSVPVNVLDSDDVRNMKKDCCYIELASPPFTAVESDFKEHSKVYINGSALPGRFLPLASGDLMADFILNNL